MRRIIETGTEQLTNEARKTADKNIGRFCQAELNGLDRLHDLLYSEIMDKIMVTVTTTGNVGFIWIFIALVLFLSQPDKKYGYFVLISLVICITIGNLLIKNIVRRARPFFHKNYKLLIKQPWDYSFPSGHTLSSFAAAVSLFYLDTSVGILALIYASLIALSRLYLRVHFFTDVFFSMVLGTSIGIIAVKVYENYLFKFLENLW